MNLYKTTIVIWSEYDGSEVDLEDLAREAVQGDAYCSKQISELIAEAESDVDWDGTEFFDQPDAIELVPIVGQRYTDDSHPEEPSFVIIELSDTERVAELDNGQWYELDGPEGFLTKLASGVIRPVDPS